MIRLMNIEMTSYCPANCSMCPRHLIRDFGYLSNEVINNIISNISKKDLWEISFAGRGEPTLHPDFTKILEQFHQLNIPISVVTTGIALSDEKIYACEKYVDKIRLSISSINKEVFEKVHIGLDYFEVWENIKKLLKREKNKIIVHLVGGEVIYDSLPETVNFLRDLGIKRIHLLPLWNRGDSLEEQNNAKKREKLINELNLESSESEYLNFKSLDCRKHFESEKLKNPNYCFIGDSSISINFKGDVLGCFQDFGNKFQLGNICYDNFENIFEKRSKFLGNMEICKKCNSKKTVIDLPK